MNDFNENDDLVEMPPRSKLVSLIPYGIGTPYVESLASYFLRLADIHCLPPWFLTRQLIRPFYKPKATQSAKQFDRFWQSPTISGATMLPRIWVDALTELTGQKNLCQLTLLPFEGGIPSLNLMSSYRKWCPLCLLELQNEGQPYSFLLWDISIVRACPFHQIELVWKCGCPDDQRLSPLNVRHLPWLCRRCGRSLARVMGDPSITKASDEDSRIAKLVADLIFTKVEFDQERGSHVEGIKTFFSGLVSLAGGEITKAASLLGVEKGQFHGWLKGNHLPRLEALVMVASILACPIADILRGHAPTVIPTPLPFHRKRVVGKRSQRNSKLMIRKKLECLLELSPPLSITQAGWLIGVDTKYMRENFADLYAEFLGRFRESCQKASKARREERIQLILEAARELARTGRLPTRRRLSEALEGRLGCSTPNDRGTLKGICQQVRREFGFLQ